MNKLSPENRLIEICHNTYSIEEHLLVLLRDAKRVYHTACKLGTHFTDLNNPSDLDVIDEIDDLDEITTQATELIDAIKAICDITQTLDRHCKDLRDVLVLSGFTSLED